MGFATMDARGIQPYSGSKLVLVGNSAGVSIFGVGTFPIPHIHFKLKNVLIVPGIQKQLLLVSRFTNDYNYCFMFYSWGFIIKDLKTNQLMYKGFMLDGLYLIHSKPLSPSPVGLLATKTSSTMWHARLSHPSSRTLQYLLQHLPSFNKNISFCESCTLGKSAKLPFQSH